MIVLYLFILLPVTLLWLAMY